MELRLTLYLRNMDCLKHVIFAFMFLVSHVHGITENLNPCPSGWYYSNLRCYKVFLYKGNRYFDRSWGIANEICKANDAYLVTYNSPLEAYAIQQYLQRSGIEPMNLYWIGLRVSNGVEQWVDGGDTTKYTHWHSGLPPEWLEVETDDGVAVADAKGNWYKVPNNWVVRIDGCDEPSGFVCEQRADIADIFHKHYAHQHLLHNQIQLHDDDAKASLLSNEVAYDLVAPSNKHSVGDGGGNDIGYVGKYTKKPLYNLNVKSTVPSVKGHGPGGRDTHDGVQTGNSINDQSDNLQTGSLTIHQSDQENPSTTEASEETTEVYTTEDLEITTEGEEIQSTTALYDMTGGESNIQQNGESEYDYEQTSQSSYEQATEVTSTSLPDNMGTEGPENRLGFGIFLGASANRAAAVEETNSTEYEYEDITTPESSTQTPYPLTTTDADSVTERMISNSAPYQRSMSPASDYKYTYEPSYHFVNVTVFCATHGAGIHEHPLHCWQFLICGHMFNGPKEGYCYPGRRFRQKFNGCVPDKTCIYGSRFVGRENNP